MKALRLLAVAALAVAASSPSFALTFNLGALSVPSVANPVTPHHAEAINTVFNDDFTFSYTAAGGATTTGVVFDYAPLNDILLTNVALYSGVPTGTNTLIQSTAVTGSPFTFTFASQPSGSYFLRVTGKTLQGDGDDYYTSRISLVPEPGTLALFGLGLTAAGFAGRRGRKSVTVAG